MCAAARARVPADRNAHIFKFSGTVTRVQKFRHQFFSALSNMLSEAEREEALERVEEDEEQDENELLHNLNMYSVLSWKLSVGKIASAVVIKHPLERFHEFFTVNLFRLLPIVLVWCEVVILIGILDEGAKIKYLTEHDKTFQFPRFIWSKTSPQAECQADAKLQQWLQDQAKDEVANCLIFGSQLANFSNSVSFAADNFFEKYEAFYEAAFSEDLTYVLTHCFPWAYGDICGHILSSRPNIETDAAAGLGGCPSDDPDVWDSCAYRACYMPQEATFRFGGQSRITIDQWNAVKVPLSEISALALLASKIQATALVPEQRKARAAFLSAFQKSAVQDTYAGNSEFICWMMQQQFNRRKSFASKPEDLSIYLFEQLHWVYALGVGETHAVELLAIIFLSFYVYTTALFDELMQLMYQLRANVVFSGSSPPPLFARLCCHSSSLLRVLIYPPRRAPRRRARPAPRAPRPPQRRRRRRRGAPCGR